ncbi:MAG: hypothetical protein HY507_01755 [Candidatus Zambryskibacteria bacterium]|nr:hypothetical protein [Candidatus Zambryskibacteria bacterium]
MVKDLEQALVVYRERLKSYTRREIEAHRAFCEGFDIGDNFSEGQATDRVKLEAMEELLSLTRKEKQKIHEEIEAEVNIELGPYTPSENSLTSRLKHLSK